MLYWRKKIKICIFLSISGFVLIWRFQNRQFRPILVVFLVPLWHQNDHLCWSKLEDSLGGCWGCMWKSNFLNQKVLAISKVKNSPFTFSKPAPEASPVQCWPLEYHSRIRYGLGWAWQNWIQTRNLFQIENSSNWIIILVFFTVTRSSRCYRLLSVVLVKNTPHTPSVFPRGGEESGN